MDTKLYRMDAGDSAAKDILVCGHRSFAARGLGQILASRGHRVANFSRGPLARADDTLTGPIEELNRHPHLRPSYDTVVNYILLKDRSIEDNVAYIAALLRLCRERSVKHLVHISSISTYASDVVQVDENSAVETNPARKGAYGGLKVATEQAVLAGIDGGRTTGTEAGPTTDIKLSLVRPGFILGEGLADPLAGMGLRLPWNKLLVLGAAENNVPIISRALLNEALVRIVENPPETQSEMLLLAGNSNPTRRDYLQACCERLGCGVGVTAFPVPLWLCAGAAGGLMTALLGKSDLRVFSKIRSVCRTQVFSSKATQKRLGLELNVDWRAELQNAVDGQRPNFELETLSVVGPASVPVASTDRDAGATNRTAGATKAAGAVSRTAGVSPVSHSEAAFAFERVAFIGFGRIVKQKHLPALKRLNFSGKIEAYDLVGRASPPVIPKAGGDARPTGPAGGKGEIPVRGLEELRGEGLFVVASPGPQHAQALPLLRAAAGTVLIEKPLAYSVRELDGWLDFAAGRKRPVLVCHNYRFKANVREMFEHLARYNPGRLLHAAVDFQSPSVTRDAAVWMRDERRARTLLMDYALHYLDLACMFSKGPWELSAARCELDALGHTRLIEGRIQCETYSVAFLLRQGFIPRRACVRLTFQNYAAVLRFFPDTFVPWMSGDNPWLYALDKRKALRATARKAWDKLTGGDADDSHARVYRAAGQPDDPAARAITAGALRGFYTILLSIAEQVYG